MSTSTFLYVKVARYNLKDSVTIYIIFNIQKVFQMKFVKVICDVSYSISYSYCNILSTGKVSMDFIWLSF